MKINHNKFKKLLSKIPFTTLDEVSILLHDDYFDCKLKKEICLKPIMFLGLNRSLPHIYTSPYHNMRGAIFETLEEIGRKKIKEGIQNSYLSDFAKYSILKESFKGKKFTKAGEILRFVRSNPDVLDKCGKVLEKEIGVFQIQKVFCFGGGVYDLIRKHFKKEFFEETSKKFSEKIDDRGVDFIKLDHYAKSNRRYYGRFKKDLERYCL